MSTSRVTKIIHFHLAKTAGTSMNRWLELLAPADRVCPATHEQQFSLRRSGTHPETGSGLELDASWLVTEFGREARAYWDVIHGHSPDVMVRHPFAYRFVILREPSSRLVSFLRDWRRLSASEITDTLVGDRRDMYRSALHCDANGFVMAYAATPAFRRMSQASSLRHAALWAFRAGAGHPPGLTALDVARRALDELFDYVGVFEDLAGAVRRIARDVGAAPPAEVPQANAGHRDPARDVLSPEALALLQDAWADDYALHAHATTLARRFASVAYDESAFEQGPLMTRLSQLTPYYTGWGRGFSLNDQLVGSGFHGREAPHTSGAHAWTGPGPRSVLYAPVPADERLDVFVDVAGYVTPQVQTTLRIWIDGREVRLVRRPAAGVVERIWCRVFTSRPYVKVEILVGRAYSADELGTGPDDLRKMGLAVSGYGYRVVPSTDQDMEPGGVLAEGVNAPDAATRSHDPDHHWALAFARDAVGAHRTEDEVLARLTFGIHDGQLQSAVTRAGLEEAFRRVLCRPPAQDWIDFWVDQPHKSLRQVYRDLIAGQEFRWRRQRLS